MSEFLLEVEDVHKSYGAGQQRVEVLQGVTMTLGKGESVALLGASGAGKSTLMQLIGALDRPSSGTIRFAGENIFAKNEMQLAAFRNRAIGFVFQFHHLLPEFTAVENVMLPALINGASRSSAANEASEILAEVGLSHRLEHKPGELSGGEQQRVAIARALIMEPQLLLADEPTGNLDKGTSDSIHALFAELHKRRGLTLLVVTHNERLAARTDRQLSLVDGKLQC